MLRFLLLLPAFALLALTLTDSTKNNRTNATNQTEEQTNDTTQFYTEIEVNDSTALPFYFNTKSAQKYHLTLDSVDLLYYTPAEHPRYDKKIIIQALETETRLRIDLSITREMCRGMELFFPDNTNTTKKDILSAYRVSFGELKNNVLSVNFDGPVGMCPPRGQFYPESRLEIALYLQKSRGFESIEAVQCNRWETTRKKVEYTKKLKRK